MHHVQTKLATLALVAILAIPVGAAQWYSYGSFEPDTSLDDPTFQYATPPGDGEAKVYFNAYTTLSLGGSSGLNPNVGAAKSRLEVVGLEEHWAMLGIWTDCNGDGYVGLAESAMREYPSALLLDDSTCPAVSSPAGSAAHCWTNINPCPAYPATGWNNLGGWVTELIPIGGPETTGGDYRLRKDSAAAVWGDYGQPDEDAADTDGGTCAISPLPRGTLQTTGGAITYVDCFGGALGVIDVWNEVWRADQPVLGVPLPGAGDPLGVRFENVDDGSSGQLGAQETLGDDDSEHAIVHVADCSDPDAYAVPWPGGLPAAFYDNFGGGIRNPDTSYTNPGGNVAGTVNYTREALPLPEEPGGQGQGPNSTSNCDFDDDRGQDVYLLEGDFNSVLVTNKHESDWNFAFQTMSRGGAPLGVAFGPLSGAGFASGPVRGAPSDAGLEPFNAVCTICQQSEWFAGSTLTNKQPQTVATRDDVVTMFRTGDVGAEVDGGYWLSFYATVGGATLTAASVPGGLGIYGAAQCGEHDSGIHAGWNCDLSQWNLNADGQPNTAAPQIKAYPGKTYNLRDVDCYDGGIDAVGLGAGVAYYGADPCGTASP